MIYGFGEGWHEAEYRRRDRPGVALDERTIGAADRGTGAGGANHDARRVAAAVFRCVRRHVNDHGGRHDRSRNFEPDADFEWSVTVPADALARSAGAVAIETDRVYLPGPAEGTADERHLGLRIFDLRVNPVSP